MLRTSAPALRLGVCTEIKMHALRGPDVYPLASKMFGMGIFPISLPLHGPTQRAKDTHRLRDSPDLVPEHELDQDLAQGSSTSQ